VRPIAWPFDVCRVLDNGLDALFVRTDEAPAEGNITRFIASTEDEDRALDVVSQNWNLESFKANSPILNNHDPFQVVGVGVRAEVVNGALEIDVRWDDTNPDPSVRSVGHQHKTGVRKAGSVGFRAASVTERHLLPKSHRHFREPVKIETPIGTFEHSGLFFDAPELLEFSSATIPMNPQALQRSFAVQRGLVFPGTSRSALVLPDFDAFVKFLESLTPAQRERVSRILAPQPQTVREKAQRLLDLINRKPE
jgi:hypothetical protein